MAIRAIRASSSPSRAISRTAASRMRVRAFSRTGATLSGGAMADHPAERARAFVDEVLIPREVAAERAGGRLPESEVELIRREALARSLAGGLHAVEHG